MKRLALVAALCAALAAPVQAAEVFLTVSDSSPWAVPADWNSLSNSVECIGSGGGSGSASGGGSEAGGGGGAYAKVSNITLTPGGTAAFSIGTGGLASNVATAGNPSWFKTTGTVFAAGSGVVTGGLASASVGTVKYNGGGGDNGGGYGGAGGGAAGPNGAGQSAVTTTGGAGDAGFGGAGGTLGNSGSAGTEWGARGSGGGAGGGDIGVPSGTPGQYGAGGGGTADNTGNTNGAHGICRIVWNPRQRISSGVF